MLQGKAKEEVLNYYATSTECFLLCNKEFDDLPLIVQQSICIVFFDSVGFYINPFAVCLIYTSFGYIIRFKDINMLEIESDENEFETRTEATTKAIEKAVEIFNQLNK